MSVDVKHALGDVGLALLALAMMAYGGWGLLHEAQAKVTDPHALIFGTGLLIFPSIPRRLAAAVRTVGQAAVDVYRAKTTAGSHAP